VRYDVIFFAVQMHLLTYVRVYSQIAAHLLLLLVTWFVEDHVTSALPSEQRHRHQHDTLRSRHAPSADTPRSFDAEVPFESEPSADTAHQLGTARSRHAPSADTPPSFDTEVPFLSERVAFSDHRPVSPPWSLDRASASAELLSRAGDGPSVNRTAPRAPPPRRHRRSATAADGYVTLPSHPALLQPVCDSVSEWV